MSSAIVPTTAAVTPARCAVRGLRPSIRSRNPHTVRASMNALKGSYQPLLALGLLAAMGAAPRMLQDKMLSVLARNATAVMTNVPGESGNPGSKHYGDLLGDWAADRYHPMVYSRKAVEAAMEERIVLRP